MHVAEWSQMGGKCRVVPTSALPAGDEMRRMNLDFQSIPRLIFGQNQIFVSCGGLQKCVELFVFCAHKLQCECRTKPFFENARHVLVFCYINFGQVSAGKAKMDSTKIDIRRPRTIFRWSSIITRVRRCTTMSS